MINIPKFSDNHNQNISFTKLQDLSSDLFSECSGNDFLYIQKLNTTVDRISDELEKILNEYKYRKLDRFKKSNQEDSNIHEVENEIGMNRFDLLPKILACSNFKPSDFGKEDYIDTNDFYDFLKNKLHEKQIPDVLKLLNKNDTQPLVLGSYDKEFKDFLGEIVDQFCIHSNVFYDQMAKNELLSLFNQKGVTKKILFENLKNHIKKYLTIYVDATGEQTNIKKKIFCLLWKKFVLYYSKYKIHKDFLTGFDKFYAQSGTPYQYDLFEKFNKGEIFSQEPKYLKNNGLVFVVQDIKAFLPFSEMQNNIRECLKSDDKSGALKMKYSFRVKDVDRKGQEPSLLLTMKSSESPALNHPVKSKNDLEDGMIYEAKLSGYNISHGGYVSITVGRVNGIIETTEVLEHRDEFKLRDFYLENNKENILVRYIGEHKGKLMFSFKRVLRNLVGGLNWEEFINNYKVNDLIDVKILSKESFGYFVLYKDGVLGLFHYSQYQGTGKEYQLQEVCGIEEKTIKLKIIAILKEKKRLTFGFPDQ